MAAQTVVLRAPTRGIRWWRVPFCESTTGQQGGGRRAPRRRDALEHLRNLVGGEGVQACRRTRGAHIGDVMRRRPHRVLPCGGPRALKLHPPLVGSSRNSRGGLVTSATPMLVRCGRQRRGNAKGQRHHPLQRAARAGLHGRCAQPMCARRGGRPPHTLVCPPLMPRLSTLPMRTCLQGGVVAGNRTQGKGRAKGMCSRHRGQSRRLGMQAASGTPRRSSLRRCRRGPAIAPPPLRRCPGAHSLAGLERQLLNERVHGALLGRGGLRHWALELGLHTCYAQMARSGRGSYDPCARRGRPGECRTV